MRVIRNAFKNYLNIVVNKITRYIKENSDVGYQDWANNKYVNPIFDVLGIFFKIFVYFGVLALFVGFAALFWDIAKWIFNLIFQL